MIINNNTICIQIKIKKKVGFFKDELNGKILTEFVGLRAKMYSCQDDDEQQKNTGKGTKKAVLKRKNHETYIKTLFHNENKKYYDQKDKMTFIRSSMFNLRTIQSTKKHLVLTMIKNTYWMMVLLSTALVIGVLIL